MKQVLLDTSALLALRDNESGADRVASLLKDPAVECYACFMTRMEVLYRVWKDENEVAGKLALQQCLALPLKWIEASDELLIQAAEIKAGFSISVVDAWIGAAALRQLAILLHKNPEFDVLSIAQERLPMKPKLA